MEELLRTLTPIARSEQKVKEIVQFYCTCMQYNSIIAILHFKIITVTIKKLLNYCCVNQLNLRRHWILNSEYQYDDPTIIKLKRLLIKFLHNPPILPLYLYAKVRIILPGC